ncbi:NAD-dependent deacetylase domain protein [[Clostridium] sordellii ATCC 9714]|nr:NAD-dependent deacetylase domain protein [[Clostridium] sordellii ATCC 9714] [Paeniclostridium sordellii ATCC 9714]
MNSKIEELKELISASNNIVFLEVLELQQNQEFQTLGVRMDCSMKS